MYAKAKEKLQEDLCGNMSIRSKFCEFDKETRKYIKKRDK